MPEVMLQQMRAIKVRGASALGIAWGLGLGRARPKRRGSIVFVLDASAMKKMSHVFQRRAAFQRWLRILVSTRGVKAVGRVRPRAGCDCRFRFGFLIVVIVVVVVVVVIVIVIVIVVVIVIVIVIVIV